MENYQQSSLPRWGKYNYLFPAKQSRWLLYNALSNSLFELNHFHYVALEHIAAGNLSLIADLDRNLIVLLQKHKMLVEKDEETHILRARHHQRNSLSYDNSELHLSVCPTLRCNFRCPYCFEGEHKTGSVMSDKTIGRLISFIKTFSNVRQLSISWYGGEPTLAFSIIHNITRQIQPLGIPFSEAGLVTNAYLLDKGIIDQLNDLNIKTVQITIDGPEHIHDARRMLADGSPTYRTIIDNIDALMNSSYAGSCNIRVNLDKSNMAAFFALRTQLLERYKGKSFSVYAGPVDNTEGNSTLSDCSLCAADWNDFTLALYRHEDNVLGEGVYPPGRVFNICSANRQNSFVVGPEGELYKCWEDVGRCDRVIGNIHHDIPITNPELVALYSIGTDPYLDSECVQCKVFPICSGGCVNRRLRKKHFGETGLDYCSLFKDYLAKYLLEYYDKLRTRELCASLLGSQIPTNDHGYRVLSAGSPEGENQMGD